MPAYKDKNGTWYVSYFEHQWTGEKKRRVKRGFRTKREADDFLARARLADEKSLNMTFEQFVGMYFDYIEKRVKTNTMETKKCIVEERILPYFKKKKMNEIVTADIVMWQNKMLAYRDKNGEPYSPVYLKTIHNQLSAIFNYACTHYDLPSNPARKCGSMGKERNGEMEFWTKEEYQKFAEVMMQKDGIFQAFEMLYWCGLRLGEMLALTPADFDFEKKTVRINKSLQVIRRKIIITDPKTAKSKRIVLMPNFLVEEMKDYIERQYDLQPTDRIFNITKSWMHHEMKRGCKESGVKKIRIHDLRHSHVSLLIEKGFSALAIADRVGHESIDITYRYAHLFPAKGREIADKLDEEREGLFNVSKE